MKKTYEKPTVTVVDMKMQSILCTSGVNSNSMYGIGWGGYDDEGVMIPD